MAGIRDYVLGTLAAERDAEATIQANKEKLLVDAVERDKLVAGFASQFSMSKAKPKYSKFNKKTDALDAANTGNPMEGFADELDRSFLEALSNPRLKYESANNILLNTASSLIAKPGQRGMSRMEEAYTYKRAADASPFGIFGEAEGVKKPLGYDNWVESKREAEDAEDAKLGISDYMASLGGVATAAGVGAAAGAGFGALGIGPLGAAPGAIVGAIAWAVSELAGKPYRTALHTTEWSKAKRNSNSIIDQAKSLGADMAVDALVCTKVGKALTNKYLLSKASLELPSATNLLEWDGFSFVGRGPRPTGFRSAGSRIGGSGSGGSSTTGKDLINKMFKPGNLSDEEGALLEKVSGAMARGEYPLELQQKLLEYQVDVDFLKFFWTNVAKQLQRKKLPGPLALKEGIGGRLPAPDKLREIVRTASGELGIIPDKDLHRKLGMQAFKSLTSEEAVDYALSNPNGFVTGSIKALGNQLAIDRYVNPKLATKFFEKEFAKYESKSGSSIYTARLIDDNLRLSGKSIVERHFGNVVQTPGGMIVDKKRLDDIAGVLVKETELARITTIDNWSPSDVIKSSVAMKSYEVPEVKQIMKEITKPTVVTPAEKKIIDTIKYAKESPAVRESSVAEESGKSRLDLIKERHALLKARRAKLTDVVREEEPVTLKEALKPGSKEKVVNKINRLSKADQEALLSGGKVSSEGQEALEDFKALEESYYAGEAGIDELFDTAADNAVSLAKGLSMLGVGAGAVAAFLSQSEESDAGVLNSILNAGDKIYNFKVPGAEQAGVLSGLTSLGKDATEILLNNYNALKGAGVLGTKVLKGQLELDAKSIQNGLKVDIKEGGPKLFLSKLNNIIATGKTGTLYRYMSPYQTMEYILKPTSLKSVGVNKTGSATLNAAVFRASHQAAEITNISSYNAILDNIKSEFKISAMTLESRKEFEKLVPFAKAQWKHDKLQDLLVSFDTKLKKMRKSTAFGDNKEAKREAILSLAGKKKAVQIKLNEFANAPNDYHAAYRNVAERAALKDRSVRISLALDDNAEFTKHPFLKNMLTFEDKAAVARYRTVLDQYKQRLKGINEDVIKEGYVHYQLPKKYLREMTKELDDELFSMDGTAFKRFFSRMPNSRMLVPDIDNTMRKYVRDAEKRIQNIDFWKPGTTDGWQYVMNSPQVQANEALKQAFKHMYEGSDPTAWTPGNLLADTISTAESFKYIWGSPSAGFKHAIKVTAGFVSSGTKNSLNSIPTAVKSVMRKSYSNPAIRDKLSALGIEKSSHNRMIDEIIDSFSPSRTASRIVTDMGIERPEYVFNIGKGIFRRVEDAGSAFINLAENFDRSVSVVTAMSVAAKKGLTIDQAIYGIYDTILKNNFLSRELNPSWMRNPKIRAMLMFQSTPFKIMERRVVIALKTGRAVKGMTKEMTKMLKEGNGDQILQDLKNLRAYVKEGENLLKSNVIADTLLAETDFFGNSVVTQFAKDLMLIGSATYLGSSVDSNLFHHFIHMPFLSSMHDEPVIAFSPSIQSSFRGYADWKNKDDTDDEFLFTKIIQRWTNGTGLTPEIFRKVSKLSNNDIPDIYGTGDAAKWRYFFAIPGKE